MYEDSFIGLDDQELLCTEGGSWSSIVKFIDLVVIVDTAIEFGKGFIKGFERGYK